MTNTEPTPAQQPEHSEEELAAMTLDELTVLGLSKLSHNDFKAVSAARWAAQHGNSPFWQQPGNQT